MAAEQEPIVTPTGRVITFFDEFKNFAFKGNVVDLAVGVVIGTAFGAIIKSLVSNLIMPLLSVIIPGEQGYTEWTLTLRGEEIPFGLFLGEVVNFLIVAFALYIFIVKFIGALMKKKQEDDEATVAVPPAPSKEEILLTEIRDLLREKT